MSFGSNLKDYRKTWGMTQAELGRKLNVSQQTIGSWEKDRTEPSHELQGKIADLFNVSIDTLMGKETTEKVDLKKLIQDNAMTYGGKEISEHDLKVLEGVVNSILGGDANEDK